MINEVTITAAVVVVTLIVVVGAKPVLNILRGGKKNDKAS